MIGISEGALAQTLFFQFADKAVTAQQALEQLFQQGRNDLRYMRIWIDVFTEVRMRIPHLFPLPLSN
jgi:hypothetical protein